MRQLKKPVKKSTEKKSDHCSKTDAEWFFDMTGFTFKAEIKSMNSSSSIWQLL